METPSGQLISQSLLDNEEALFSQVLSSRSAFVDRTHTTSPQAAFALVRRWALKAGVTRLAEATRVDRIGIPVTYAVRPAAVHPTSVVAMGKGTKYTEACLSALFESFERWALEEAAVTQHPDDPNRAETVGFDMVSRTAVKIPLWRAVFPGLIAGARFPADTHGAAASTNPAAAVYNALLEIIERRVTSTLKADSGDRVPIEVISGPPRPLAETFASAGIQLEMRLISFEFVHVAYVLSRDLHLSNRTLLCSGACAHPSAETALVGALCEVAQSRIAMILALREDLAQNVQRRASGVIPHEIVSMWFENDTRPIPSIPISHTCATTIESALINLVTDAAKWFRDFHPVAVRLRAFGALVAFRVIDYQTVQPDV